MSTHVPICMECGERWPCAAVRIDREAISFARRLDRICGYCGNEVRQGQDSVAAQGVIFHVAARYPNCRRAAAAAFGEANVA